MYLLYLDDSGSALNKSEQHLVLAGISVFERQIHHLTLALDRIAEKYEPADPFGVEFHASEIFARRISPWDNMEDKQQAREVILEVLGVLASSPLRYETRAFACAVHKDSYPDRDPMELAFEDLVSRFDMQLGRHYHRADPQRGLVILDKSSYETSFQSLARQFRSTGTRWGPLKNISEVPLFVDSKASRLVQLADHVAYAVFRRYEYGDTSYLDPIMTTFDADEGKLHGLVHKTKRLDCLCQACFARSIS